MSKESLVQEIYGKEMVKAPYQVLLQLDRYTIKEMDLSKMKKGDVIVAVYDDSNPKYPMKDFGRVTDVEDDMVTFQGEVTGQEYTVQKKRTSIPIDWKWEDSSDRMALGAASIEENYNHKDKKAFYKRIKKSLYREDIVPGGRIQASVGAKEKTGKDLNLTAYNCYVLPSPKDSRGGIMETLEVMTEIMSRGGGVGINISTLRPKYSRVFGVNGTSSGGTSWGGLYSYTTGLIEQAGSRRGALMLQMHITNPDILNFIKVKQQTGAMENANLSVQITKEFKRAVDNDEDWHLVFPDTKHPDYDEKWASEYLDIHDWLNAGLPVEIHGTMKARELNDIIVRSAHSSGEPGYVIYDYMNNGEMTSTQKLDPVGDGTYVLSEEARKEVEGVTPWNNTFYLPKGKNIATNPCGEQPLSGYAVCNLVHLNLANLKTGNKVDWERLEQMVSDAVRYADDVIDYTNYHLTENERVQKGQRRIGMGTLGLADLLIDFGLRYGSDESLAFIDELYSFIKNTAYRASAELAKVRGQFPMYDEKIMEARIPKSLDDDVKELIKEHGLRNSHLLTQAPTGTTGTKTGTKGYSVGTGIEPFFALKWERRSRLGTTIDYNGKAKEYLEVSGEEELPEYFVSASGYRKNGQLEIPPKDHIRVQAAVQKHNDSAISKTANAPKGYSVEQAKELYQFGVESGVVGVTLYVDGSIEEQVLTAVDDKKEEKEEKVEKKAEQRYDRPKRCPGETIETQTPFGKGYVTINKHPQDEKIEEIFIELAKTGSDVSAVSDGMAIALTGVLSPRINSMSQEEKLDWIIKKFDGISGKTSVGFGPNKIESLPDAIAQVLREYRRGAEEEEEAERVEDAEEGHVATGSVDICPQCGVHALVKQDGCSTCQFEMGGCGHSKC